MPSSCMGEPPPVARRTFTQAAETNGRNIFPVTDFAPPCTGLPDQNVHAAPADPWKGRMVMRSVLQSGCPELCFHEVGCDSHPYPGARPLHERGHDIPRRSLARMAPQPDLRSAGRGGKTAARRKEAVPTERLMRSARWCEACRTAGHCSSDFKCLGLILDRTAGCFLTLYEGCNTFRTATCGVEVREGVRCRSA